jgi:hypothetical protein
MHGRRVRSEQNGQAQEQEGAQNLMATSFSHPSEGYARYWMKHARLDSLFGRLINEFVPIMI